jgi:hypothetical protein
MIKTAALGLLMLLTPSLSFAWSVDGRVNTWGLYQTDDVSSTTVAVVKDNLGNVLGIAIGDDIAIECAVTGRTCEYRKIGQGTELELERVTEVNSEISREGRGKIGGDSLLWNLGGALKAKKEPWTARLDGQFTSSLLENRALLGHDRYRARFSQANVEYQKSLYRVKVGRQAFMGDVLLDGVSGEYFFGPSQVRDSQRVGFFAGLSPDPISKLPTTDTFTFGPSISFIPQFSQTSESKLLVDGALVTELYKGAMNRFYLFSRAHFTPVKSFSSILYSNLELPWSGSDGSINSSLLSLTNYYRPNQEWFFSVGLTQFRIDRYLQERAIRWVTDEGSQQATRVGESLDRSQRYRLDFRTSYKPAPFIQPYLRARYERRTFDSNKKILNTTDPDNTTTDFGLVNKKNAYQFTPGLRLFVMKHLETESQLTYGQRYQSKFISGFQSFEWDSPQGWQALLDFQYVWSSRSLRRSFPGAVGTRETTHDLYAGLGGSYRLMTDFLTQIRYDLSHENDQVLDTNVLTHSVLLRLDYKF